LEEIRETIKAILAKKPMKPAFKYNTIGKKKTWRPSQHHQHHQQHQQEYMRIRENK
jgi:hypothetical protein